MTTPRDQPYLWPIWIVGLLSGDDACEWAPWFKAHFQYERKPPGESLARWKSDHGAFMADIVTEMMADGWNVFVEDQNKLHIPGTLGTCGGKPDAVCAKGDVIRIIDGKTGRPKEKDLFQVLFYMWGVLLTAGTKHEHPAVAGRPIDDLVVEGNLRYKKNQERDRLIAPEELDMEMRLRLRDRVRKAMGPERPRRTPSRRECRFCDITSTDCPDRIDQDEPSTEVLTSEF